MNHYQVAIVGGGPAGASTALFLLAAAPALRGHVAVFDKDRFPREKICAGAVGARADRLLSRIDARPEVPSVAIHGFAVTTSRGAQAVRAERPVGRVVRRIEHDAALLAAATERGAEVRTGVRILGLERSESGVVLATSEGAVRAAVVVGADGVASVVRRALGVPPGVFHAQAVEVDTPYVARDDVPDDLLHFDLRDGSYAGYAWDFPTLVGGTPLVCRGIYRLVRGAEPARRRNGNGDVGSQLETRLAARGLAVEPKRFKRFAERGLAPHEPCATPRALLVGEAAGIDALLGEGIAQAIFYGAVAGRYLATRLAARAYSFADWPRALAGSRLGLDLRVRAHLVRWMWGKRRPMLERWVGRSASFAEFGMSYFAGDDLRTCIHGVRAGAALVRALATA